MAKKKQEIMLESFSDIDFKKEADTELAQSIIEPPKVEPSPPVPAAKPAVKRKKEPEPQPEAPLPEPPRGTFAPENKVRATFNIEEDLHKAIKAYSFHEEVNMVDYIFEQLVKPDLAAKGYYPPKKRK